MMDSENPYSPPEMDAKPIVSKPAAPLSIQAILFSFEGRIPRRVYWAASICVGFVFYGVIFGLEAAFGPESSLSLIGIFVMYIPMLWISVAVQCKRWHDRDKLGWWFLINFIPIIGPLWAFIELGCLRGTMGPNLYGADPT